LAGTPGTAVADSTRQQLVESGKQE